MKAIILAAGMGTRLRPLTENTPKALVKVNGKPMVERQIEFLHEKGIKDIIVVTGYLKEKFDYLKEKYGVNLVFNEKYDVYNNIYTMYKVKHLLPESYVVEGDVFINNNMFDDKIINSAYFSAFRPSFENEWEIITDEHDRVIDINVGDGKNSYILSGISYWDKKDGELIANELKKVVESGDFQELFWDDIVRMNFKHLNVFLKKLEETDCFEIDHIDDLKNVEAITGGNAVLI